MKYLIPSTVVFIYSLLLLSPYAMANDRTWSSAPGKYPQFSIEIEEGRIIAKTNLYSIDLQGINQLLLNDLGKRYIDIRDYNRDGELDIGVAEGAGIGASNPCYSAYQYNSMLMRFSPKPSATYCL